MPRCAGCGQPLSDWHDGAACPECGSHAGPWKPVEGKALGGRSKLVVIGWPFPVTLVAGLCVGLAVTGFEKTSNSGVLEGLMIFGGIGLLLLTLLNTSFVTYALVRHAQRKRWVSPEREGARAAVAVLIALAAGAAGCAVAGGLFFGGCFVGILPALSRM